MSGIYRRLIGLALFLAGATGCGGRGNSAKGPPASNSVALPNASASVAVAPIASTVPIPQVPEASTELVDPTDKPCTRLEDCAGSTCASFACVGGRCQKAASKPNFSACFGTGKQPHRCYSGTCFESYDCAAHCSRDLALRVASALSKEFAKCTGKDPVTCRKSKMHEGTPFFKETQRGVESCMLECGYPSLELPPQTP